MADPVVLTVRIPARSADRVLAAICGTYGYQANGLLGDQQTREQFAQAAVAGIVKGIVADFEATSAAGTAEAEARAKVENEVDLS